MSMISVLVFFGKQCSLFFPAFGVGDFVCAFGRVCSQESEWEHVGADQSPPRSGEEKHHDQQGYRT